jgi:hypothetical protein
LFGTIVCQSDTTLTLATADSRDTVIIERASTYTDVQLSFRDNAGTRGDMTGTIPAISFTGSFTGVQKLSLTLKTIGVAVMRIRLIHSGGAYSMYESEWIIVP